MYCSLIPGRMQESLSVYIVRSLCRTHVSNAAWGRWSILMKKQSFFSSRYATVNSTSVLSSHWFLACGWLLVGTNFSEWVQIFQKNSIRGEPILGGSKLNVTWTPPLYIHLMFTRCHSQIRCSHAFSVFCCSFAPMYYTEHKLKNKNGGGQGTRLTASHPRLANVPCHPSELSTALRLWWILYQQLHNTPGVNYNQILE